MTYRIEETVKVLFHLNEGYTKVFVERNPGGLADLDIPTENIPRHLRRIGSRFVLILEDRESEIRVVEIPEL